MGRRGEVAVSSLGRQIAGGGAVLMFAGVEIARTWARTGFFAVGEILLIVVIGIGVKINHGAEDAQQILRDHRIRKGQFDDS